MGTVAHLNFFHLYCITLSSSGRGILLKPAPGANQRAEEEEGEETDAEKGGRVVGKGSEGVNTGVGGTLTGMGSGGVKAGGKNPTSPPLLPLLAASRDLRYKTDVNI